MDTSPTVQSSLLKLLLRCGSGPRLLPPPAAEPFGHRDADALCTFCPRFNNVKVHLEEYLSQMEEKILSNQSHMDHIYFMVVHCLEVSAR